MGLAASEAENWVDHRAAKCQMEKLIPTAGHDHNSFDAVGIIKRTTDTRDKFYIYRIGNQNLNGWVRLCLQKLKEDGRDDSPDGCRRSREYFAAGKCLF